MKLSELNDAQLEAFLVKYIKYVAAIEREKVRRQKLKESAAKKREDSTGSASASGLVISEDDLQAAASAPITKEDLESVTRILKNSGFAASLAPAKAPGSSTLTYEAVVEEIKKSTLKLSEKKMYLKGLEKDRKAKRCDGQNLNKYLVLLDLYKKGEAKTNPHFPRNAGVPLPVGLAEVLDKEY